MLEHEQPILSRRQPLLTGFDRQERIKALGDIGDDFVALFSPYRHITIASVSRCLPQK